MRLLLLLVLVGWASASAYPDLEQAVEKMYTDMMFAEAENQVFASYAEDDVTTEMGKKLQEMLDDLVKRIKDSLEKGQGIRQDLIDKVKEIRNKMKDMHIEYKDKAKELLKKIRDRLKGILDDFWDNLKGKDDDDKKRSVVDEEQLGRIKDWIQDKIDKLKQRIEAKYGKIKDFIKDKFDKIKQRTEGDSDAEFIQVLAERGLLENILENIKEKDSELYGRIKDWIQDKIDKIKQKMDDLNFGRIKDYIKDKFDRIRQRTDVTGDDIDDEIIEALAESRLKDMFNKLKDYLKEKIDKDTLKKRIEEIFGKTGDMVKSLNEIIDKHHDKYRDIIHDLIDKYLGKKDKRSLKEWWEKIKNYFKDLHIDLQEKYAKFGEWVKEHFDKTKAIGKDKIDNIRQIAKDFIDHTKGVSKDVATEALEFLRPYKEDLGSLWDQVKIAVKDIVQKKE